MKKDFVKRLKTSIWGSNIIFIFVSSVLLWWVLYYFFSNPTLLTDFAKTLSDGGVSVAGMTWVVFGIGFPIIVFSQLGSSLLTYVLLDAKEKRKRKCSCNNKNIYTMEI